MLIVSGKIFVKDGMRDRFLQASLESVKAASGTVGCRDFVVAADPLEQNRVNVYEEWDSMDELTAFRENGPDAELTSLIINAHVIEHRIVTEKH